ncbi:MAG: alpha-ketoglutarate-dependent dioxygenase AlkB [Pseudomonadota bacterium]
MPDTLPVTEEISGFVIHRRFLDSVSQARIVADCRDVIAAAPLVQPVTAWGKPMSVRMTSAGHVGWVIKRGKYRYADRHPETGAAWPAVPASVLAVWDTVAGWPEPPSSCLINWYGPTSRMGLHQDKDEGRFDAPVVSISLGDPGRFRMGGEARKDATVSTILSSGDVVVMGGNARMAYHGIDRILRPDGGSPLEAPGRLNLTLRVVVRS